MGLFDSLFGSKPAEPPKKKAKKAAPAADAAPVTAEAGISPEVVAVIAASVYALLGASSVQAVKISRTSNTWATTGRQKIMDSRQFA